MKKTFTRPLPGRVPMPDPKAPKPAPPEKKPKAPKPAAAVVALLSAFCFLLSAFTGLAQTTNLPGQVPTSGISRGNYTNRLLWNLAASTSTNRIYFTNSSSAFGDTNTSALNIKSNSSAGRWEWRSGTTVVATNTANRPYATWKANAAGAATYGYTRYEPTTIVTIQLDQLGVLISPTNFWESNAGQIPGLSHDLTTSTNLPYTGLSDSAKLTLSNNIAVDASRQDFGLRTFRHFAGIRAANSNAQFTVTIFSDSYGAQSAWTTNVYRALKQLYGDAGQGFIYARSGAYNEQLVSLSSPGNVTPNDDANRALFSYVLLTNSTAAIQWTGLTFKNAQFYYMRTTNGGTFGIYTNGVLFATVSGNSATTNFMASTNIIHPLQTSCSLTISNVTATNYFLGAQINTTNAGIRFFNHSHSSVSAYALATNNILGYTRALETVLSNEAPNLILVDLGRNDILNGGASGIAGLYTNLTTILTRARSVQPQQEFVFISSPWMSNDLNSATSDQAAAVIKTFAASNSVGYLDLLNKLPTLTNAFFPYSSTHVDMYHPNYGGYQMYANEVTRYFTGLEWQHALRAARPVWSYEVNYKAHYSDAGFVPLDSATLSPAGIRNAAYAEASASAMLLVSVPTGLGFNSIATTFELEGASGATNQHFSTQIAAGSYSTESSVITPFTGLTNLMFKTITVTNTFTDDDRGQRHLFIKFLRHDGGANLTNRIYVNRIRLNSIP